MPPRLPALADQPTDGGDLAVPGRRVLLCCLAIASSAAAVIHFAATGEHFKQYWLFGVFMLVAAWTQLLWAAAVLTRTSAQRQQALAPAPARWLAWAGALVNAGVLAVYVVSRTVGDVIGPIPHAVEPLGFRDGLCAAFEVVVVAGCAWLLVARTERRVGRDTLAAATAATGGLTAALLSVALATGGPAMVMTASRALALGGTSAMRMAGPAAPQVRLATSSPGGDIMMPDPSMQMAPGMRMASSAPCAGKPTRAQQRAAVGLVNASWRAARKYQRLAVAIAAGYRPITPSGLPVVHYVNMSYYLAVLTGGQVLDPATPQSLVYANTPRGAVLVAAMYITSPGGPTPQPGGCLTQWHVHTNLCLRPGLGVVGIVSAASPTCPPGSANHVTPPMMHVWFVPIPGGPTAIDASDYQVLRAAEQVPARGNGTA